jgi:hypothetical protein
MEIKSLQLGEISTGNIDITLTYSYAGSPHYNMDYSFTSPGTLLLMFSRR